MERESKSVLIVDDDPIVCEWLTDLMAAEYGEALDVTWAVNGLEAEKILRGQELDVVVCDVRLPGMSGLELFSRTMRVNAETRFILITGSPDVADAVNCMKLGAVDYIEKPVKSREFLRALNEALDSRLRQATWREIYSSLRNETQLFDRYQVIKSMEEGPWTAVFLAEEMGADREVVIKVLRYPESSDSTREAHTERFLRETRVAKLSKHPNIVEVINCGVADNGRVPYLVMEYIPGHHLKYYLSREHQLDRITRVQIIRDIAAGLAEVHARAFCHWDIQPGNILVQDKTYRAKLTDFGMSGIPDPTLTTHCDIMESFSYMSPESHGMEEVTEKADVFSLGTISYELLVGQHPFMARNIGQLKHRIITETPPSLMELKSDFPVALNDIVAHMMEKEVALRCSSSEAVFLLEQYLAE